MITIGAILGGKYRIERIIAEGGMGVIVEGTHLELDTKVAIKLLRPELRTSTDAMARFVREARAVVKLESDNVVRMFDVNPSDPIAPYMVMELLDGEDLDHMIQTRGALPIPLAVSFVRQACAGLAVAHNAGIIHRDLKPGNLFYAKRPDGTARIKVVDFGISKVRDTRPNQVKLTGPTDLFGSPAYMSPEQIDGAVNADARTDVWALGAILYELVTGVSPFAGDTVPQTLVNVCTGRHQRMSKLVETVPPELEQVVVRCLSHDPRARYASVRDLADALMPFEPGAEPIALPPMLPRSKVESASTLVAVETDPSGAIPVAARRRANAIRIVAAIVLATGLIGVVALVRANASGNAERTHATPSNAAPASASAPEKRTPPEASVVRVAPSVVPDAVSIDSLPSAHPKTPTAPVVAQHTWSPPAPPSSPPPPSAKPAPPPQSPFSDFGPRK